MAWYMQPFTDSKRSAYQNLRLRSGEGATPSHALKKRDDGDRR